MPPPNPFFLLMALMALLVPVSAQDEDTGGGQPAGGDVSLDGLFGQEKLWEQTPAQVEAVWKGKGFQWNSNVAKDKGLIRRGRHGNKLTISAFGGKSKAEDVVFMFKDGKLSEVAVSIWNKGDSDNSDIQEGAFIQIVDEWSSGLNDRLGVRYEDLGPDKASAAKAERRRWVGKDILAQIEFSGGKERLRDDYPGRNRSGKNFQGEFIRLRMLPKPASMFGVEASTGGAVNVRRSDLSKSVVRQPTGDVMITGIPMVDQGDKGYCAVATAARVLNYYGVPADQHEMAQIAGADASSGTDPDIMVEAMKKISGKYKTRFFALLELDYSSRRYESFMRRYNTAAKKLGKKLLDTDNSVYFIGGLDPDVLREVNGKGQNFDRFSRSVYENIDAGIPVMWALQLGKFAENGAKTPQAFGGHMRLIIGYNKDKNEIIFSDSWGPGHEVKRMAAPDAAAATMGLYLLRPAL